jgi:hypothetical protein
VLMHYNPANLLEANFVANNDTILIKGPIQLGTSWIDNDGLKEMLPLTRRSRLPLVILIIVSKLRLQAMKMLFIDTIKRT